MAYTKREDVPADAGSIVVELDTGELVAVRCDRKRIDAGVCYHAIAQVVDAAGAPVVPALRTETKRSMPVEMVDAIGDTVVSRDMLLVVLGETPQSSLHWADIQLSGASIRVTIAAAQVAGAADAGAVL